MNSLYLVYDFEGPSGFFYNSSNLNLHQYYFENDFVFRNDIEDFIKTKKEKIPNSSNNIFFNEVKKIHISKLNSNLLDNQNNYFIYPIFTGGNNQYSLGIKKNDENDKSIFDLISNKWKKLLKRKNCNIIIYFGLEHEMPIEYFQKIYILLQNNNINPNKVWIISNNFSNIDNNNKFLDKFGIDKSKNLNFLTYYEQLKTKSNEIIDKKLVDKFINQVTYDKNIFSKSKKGLILNRRLPLHRKIFLSLIMYDNYLDSNLISFDLGFDNQRDFVDDIKNNRYVQGNIFFQKSDYNENTFSDTIKNKIIKGYSLLNKIYKNTLDVDDFKKIDGRALEIDDKRLYEKTCFSVISETEMFSNFDRYITEKSIKPIQQLHPFIMIAPYGSLQYLKSLGFKTFDKWWDESYDLEKNNIKRLLMVYDLFKSLNEKSFEEWNKIHKEMKSILIYNKENLKNYSYKNDNIVLNNLKKYLSNEHIQENPKLLQTP